MAKTIDKDEITILLDGIEFKEDTATEVVIQYILAAVTEINQADVTKYRDELIIKLLSPAVYDHVVAAKVHELLDYISGISGGTDLTDLTNNVSTLKGDLERLSLSVTAIAEDTEDIAAIKTDVLDIKSDTTIIKVDVEAVKADVNNIEPIIDEINSNTQSLL